MQETSRGFLMDEPKPSLGVHTVGLSFPSVGPRQRGRRAVPARLAALPPIQWPWGPGVRLERGRQPGRQDWTNLFSQPYRVACGHRQRHRQRLSSCLPVTSRQMGHSQPQEPSFLLGDRLRGTLRECLRAASLCSPAPGEALTAPGRPTPADTTPPQGILLVLLPSSPSPKYPPWGRGHPWEGKGPLPRLPTIR